MTALELGNEVAHDLALAAEPPEADDVGAAAIGRRAAREDRRRRDGERQCDGVSSHPPVNPARFKPAITYGFFFIVAHTRPVR